MNETVFQSNIANLFLTTYFIIYSNLNQRCGSRVPENHKTFSGNSRSESYFHNMFTKIYEYIKKFSFFGPKPNSLKIAGVDVDCKGAEQTYTI